MLRQPICVFMGHVDHGKTSIADSIRKTAVAKQEAGAITQMISSSSISLQTIEKICKGLIQAKTLKVPGLLFIDTPGHAAFTHLRKRGGSLADLAVLVIDANQGVQAQTTECVEILKQYKTPFVIALNKIDMIAGWRTQEKLSISKSIESQTERTKTFFDTKLYETVGKMYGLGFNADRFDNISDFTKQIAIVPTSAQTGEGIPELLMMLIGIAQRFLEENLELSEECKGTVLEVKDVKGVGKTIDAIIYDGILKAGDTIVIGGMDEPIVARVKALLMEEKGKLVGVKEVYAAAGVKIDAPDADNVLAGMPFRTAGKDIEQTKEDVQKEVDEVVIETDEEGVVIKADSLGSLEALSGLLKQEGITIKKASIGEITKKDIADASSDIEHLNRVLLGFNVKNPETNEVKAITSDIIYKIIEDLKKWKEAEIKRQEKEELEKLTKPAKIQILNGCIFRQSNPAVVGVEVMGGKLTKDVELIKLDNSNAGQIKGMQLNQKEIEEAKRGDQVAISLPGITAGRQIKEGDILLVNVPERDYVALKESKKFLTKDDIEVLKELAEIKRKENSVWGV